MGRNSKGNRHCVLWIELWNLATEVGFKLGAPTADRELFATLASDDSLDPRDSPYPLTPGCGVETLPSTAWKSGGRLPPRGEERACARCGERERRGERRGERRDDTGPPPLPGLGRRSGAAA